MQGPIDHRRLSELWTEIVAVAAGDPIRFIPGKRGLRNSALSIAGSEGALGSADFGRRSSNSDSDNFNAFVEVRSDLDLKSEIPP